ncbi:MAG: amidase [Gemmataceae bacterium]
MPDPLTIHEASALIQSGALTPSELLEQCLGRVDEYEAKIQAWVHLDRDRVRFEAHRLTWEFQCGQSRGPLHGIPVGIKDIIDVFCMPTACGSPGRTPSLARHDAECVSQLRDAGAIIMGKTVTTPFAFLDPPKTRNPWNLDRTPGGSSSGSAAAVASGMCLAALGSQTGGSLTRPASFCGVASFKPSHGMFNLERVMPLAPRLDHLGIMTRSAKDFTLLWRIFSNRTVPDQAEKAASCRLIALTGQFEDMLEPTCRTLYHEALNALFGANTDHRLEFREPPAGFSDWAEHHKAIMSFEAAVHHAAGLDQHPDEYPPRIRELIQAGQHTPVATYAKANQFQRTLTRQFHDWLDGAIAVTSATVGPAPDRTTTGNPAFNSPWSFLGMPTVSIPFGRDEDGLPLSFQLIGSRHSESTLLALAIDWESRTGFTLGLPHLTSQANSPERI